MESFGVHAKDLEGDFDPEAYDGAMQQLFDNQYYEQGTEGDEEKPQFSDLEGEYTGFQIEGSGTGIPPPPSTLMFLKINIVH